MQERRRKKKKEEERRKKKKVESIGYPAYLNWSRNAAATCFFEEGGREGREEVKTGVTHFKFSMGPQTRGGYGTEVFLLSCM